MPRSKARKSVKSAKPDKSAANAKHDKLPHWPGKPRVYPTPRTREPFINTPLIELPAGNGHGPRYWISTYNALNGCTAALIDTAGGHRMFHFPQHPGLYSATAENDHILWACGDLAKVVRIDVDTGDVETFDTGAPSGLVFQGIRLDPATGKLFAAAFPAGRTTAFSFDTRKRQTVAIHHDITTDMGMRFSFPIHDGKYAFVFHSPGESIVQWDPASETVTSASITENLDGENLDAGTTLFLAPDDAGRWYIPNRGWYDSKTGDIDPSGPRPKREATWLAARGRGIYGINADHDHNTTVEAWSLNTGDVRKVCGISDGDFNVRITHDEKVLAVSLYGVVTQHDARTGQLESSRRLPAEAIQTTDCLLRLDKHRLLGTPFITQRFWEINLDTGAGVDCGRAAPGVGEVLLTFKVGKLAYMAAYTSGALVEYDPRLPARFPENPRVVAQPPHAMRPNTGCDDGRFIYYSCSTPYGTLGCTVTRYDTQTGQTLYARNPLGDQRITAMVYDKKHHQLIAGTSPEADCGSAPLTETICWFARLSAADLSVIEKAPALPTARSAGVVGSMSKGKWLAVCNDAAGKQFTTLNAEELRTPAPDDMHPLPSPCYGVIDTGKPGRFLLILDGRLELWDLRKPKALSVMYESNHIAVVHVQSKSIYLSLGREIVMLEDALKGA